MREAIKRQLRGHHQEELLMREAIKRQSRGHSRGAACRCAQDEARGRRDGARVLGCSPPLIWRAARSAPCRAPPSRASCQGAGPEAGGGRGAKGGERGGGGGFRARVRAHSNQGPSRANKGKSMAINGNQSQSMAINGNQWQSMAINDEPVAQAPTRSPAVPR